MGIRGLQSYMEEDSELCPETCISELIKENESASKRRPLIVIDLSSTIYHMFSGVDWLSGGNFQLFELKACYWIEKFVNLGADLEFWCDGSCPTAKIPEKIQRKRDKLVEVEKAIFKNQNLSEIKEKYPIVLPPSTTSTLRYIISRKKHCKVYTAVEEADGVVAVEANRKNAIAVIAQDSDFVCMKGRWKYISAKDINLERMTSRCYNSRTLAHKLGLKVDHLPLLATLIGNDIVQKHLLKVFHSRITNNIWEKSFLYQKIADYVAQFNPSLTENDFEKIAKETSVEIELLMISVNSYSVNQRSNLLNIAEHGSTIRVAYNKALIGEMHSKIFSILKDQVVFLDVPLENPNCEFIQTSIAEIYRPVRQRFYKLLFSKTFVKCVQEILDYSIMIDFGTNEFTQAIGFPELWNNDVLQLRRFLYCIFGYDKSHKVLSRYYSIQLKFMFPMLVLSYLCHSKVAIYDWEIRSFLITFQLLLNGTGSDSKLLTQQLDLYDHHAVHLAWVFLSGVSLFEIINSACGNYFQPEVYLPLKYFNGLMFQKIYQTLKMDKLSYLNDDEKSIRTLRCFLDAIN